MTKKSPKLIRKNIEKTKEKVDFVRRILERHSAEKAFGIGVECQNTASELKALLENHVVPTDYKVGVVGRFKAGKSAFINELLGQKLAGEDTSPETAAVTTFRYGDKVCATVHFIQRSDWEGLKALFEQNNEDIDAYRFRNWRSFSHRETKLTAGGQTESFDLDKLEQQYVREGGHTIDIVLDTLAGKKGESEFHKRIKHFTSGMKPHHCLVEAIDITVPISILDEGVLLIDTPGFGDTERFRVSLTERAVENIDAVLFLTKSGASYDHSEKNFLLTLLRKGTVKQLIFVITQIDHTYKQHLDLARDQDEYPQTLSERIALERVRIQDELEKTLLELGQGESPAMQRYREQLGEVSLVFTSVRYHRDWKAGETVKYPLKVKDPGGIEDVKTTLLNVLSTHSRLALAARNISSGAGTILGDLLKTIDDRRTAVRQIKNQEVAEQKLGTFRLEFRKTSEEFLGLTLKDVELLKVDLTNREAVAKVKIENIIYQARSELDAFQVDDAGRHWKTRRSGRWGYMYGLQARVANRIFPHVQELLSDQTEQFSNFVSRFNNHLKRLSGSSSRISDQLELESAVSLNIASALGSFLERVTVDSDAVIDSEEQKVIALLEDFVSEEVQERISDKRAQVSAIFGSGTTSEQTREIKLFYVEVKRILEQALLDHLNARYEYFRNYLYGIAQSLPERTLTEARSELARAEENIRAAAESTVSGQKEKFEQVVSEIGQSIDDAFSAVDLLLPEVVSQPSTVSAIQDVIVLSDARNDMNVTLDSRSAQIEGSHEQLAIQVAQTESFCEAVRGDATECAERNNLIEDQQNWPYRRIFRPDLLKGATRAVLIDPHLSKFHQIRNLKDFIIAIDEATKLRELCIMTHLHSTESGPGSDASFRDLAIDLYKENGIQLSIVRDSTLHDRSVVFDHGVLFKLGRGLDIYKPATGLAAHRPESRKVRSCQIDVFVIPNKS